MEQKVTHYFGITRPIIFMEYSSSESPVEMEEPVTLTEEQIRKLKREFDPFALEISSDSEKFKCVQIRVESYEFEIILETKSPVSPEKISEIEELFDQWFVEDACPTWSFDLIPFRRWIELGYRK